MTDSDCESKLQSQIIVSQLWVGNTKKTDTYTHRVLFWEPVPGHHPYGLKLFHNGIIAHVVGRKGIVVSVKLEDGNSDSNVITKDFTPTLVN